MTKVAFIQMFPPFYRRDFLERLASDSDLEVHFVAGQPRAHNAVRIFEEFPNGHVQLIRNRFTPRWLPELCWQTGCVDWLKQVRPDVIFLQPTPRMVTNYSVIRWARRNRAAVAGWGMGQMPGLRGLQARLQSALVQTLISKLDAMICYSTTAMGYYESLGFARDKLDVAYNSLNTDECLEHYARLQNLDWRLDWFEAHDLDPQTPTVVFVGRLIESKCIDRLIDSLGQVKTPCQLVVVGDGPARSDLVQLAKEKQVTSRFTGHQEGEALAKAFMAADFFVLPALGGLAIQHAMAYGKPVIVSIGDGTEADLVEDDANGFMFARGDWRDLNRKIEQMFRSSDRWSEMGARSKEIIATRVNLENMVEVFRRGIRQLAEKANVDR